MTPEQISDRAAVARVLTQLTSHASLVFAIVAEVRDQVLAIVGRERDGGLDAFDEIELIAERHLVGRTSIPRGLGFVADPTAFPDLGGLQWWCRSGPGGAIRRLVVSIDPGSLDFYDYTVAPWFVGTRAGSGAHVTGPYVDATGTNEYVITFSEAIVDSGRFLGVAGVDVLVGTLQSVMHPAMRAIRGDACLVDEEGLVIVTNTPHLLAGAVLETAREEDARATLAWAPWQLTVRSGAGPAPLRDARHRTR